MSKLTSHGARRAAGLLLAASLGVMLGTALCITSFLVPMGLLSRVLVAGGPVPAAVRAAQTSVAELPATPKPDEPEVSRDQDDTAPAQSEGTPAPAPGPAPASARVTVLVLGVDSRPHQSAGRSDTMMVLTANPDTGSAAMISLPRDLLVEVPGMAGKAKINTANFFGDAQKYPGGGPELARLTVSDFLGYPVDHWVRLDFEGFRQIVDEAGGIDVDVPNAIDDPLYPDDNYGYDPLYIQAGRIHMDGALALKYARTRHADSDYGRARRQQQVVKALGSKLLQPRTLASLLPRLPALASSLAKSVQTDMPAGTMLQLAGELALVDFSDPTTLVIDDKLGSNSSDPHWGFVLIPDMARVREAAAQVLADSPTGGPAVVHALGRAAGQAAPARTSQ